MKTITLDGEEYVPKSAIKAAGNPAKTKRGMKYVICRTYSAGVFAGYLESRKGQEAVLQESRRIWYWKGAASLSELAVEGPNAPRECKFAVPVNDHEVIQVIEIIPCTKKAQESIQSVPVWTVN